MPCWDVARTAFQVPGAGLSPSAKVGHLGLLPRGGQASLWGGPSSPPPYAPSLQVAGDAGWRRARRPECDRRGALNGGLFAGFAADAVIGLHSAYPDMPFTALLNSTGTAAVSRAESLCLLGTITAFAGAHIENFTTGHLTLNQISALHGPEGNLGLDHRQPGAWHRARHHLPDQLSRCSSTGAWPRR